MTPAPVLATNHLLRLDDEADHETEHFKLIESFRNHNRLSIKPTVANSAFAAAEGDSKPKGNRTPSFRNNNSKPSKCICDYEHWFGDCYHLRHYFSIKHPKAPAGWKPKDNTMKKIREALDNNATQKTKVKKAIDRSIWHEEHPSEKKEDAQDKEKAQAEVYAVVGGGVALEP